MGSLKRKIERAKERRAKKELQEQIKMFHKLGDECYSCQKAFDKKSKEYANTWKVIVREKENAVRLYCPECWDTAMAAIQEVENDSRILQEK
tara:strand:- start:1192 stop:1467 length:276 start_codon:yes stop_codon:yes gene_type:complete